MTAKVVVISAKPTVSAEILSELMVRYPDAEIVTFDHSGGASWVVDVRSELRKSDIQPICLLLDSELTQIPNNQNFIRNVKRRYQPEFPVLTYGPGGILD